MKHHGPQIVSPRERGFDWANHGEAESDDGAGAYDRSWPFCEAAADTEDIRLSG